MCTCRVLARNTDELELPYQLELQSVVYYSLQHSWAGLHVSDTLVQKVANLEGDRQLTKFKVKYQRVKIENARLVKLKEKNWQRAARLSKILKNREDGKWSEWRNKMKYSQRQLNKLKSKVKFMWRMSSQTSIYERMEGEGLNFQNITVKWKNTKQF